jgi:hypothetical protein
VTRLVGAAVVLLVALAISGCGSDSGETETGTTGNKMTLLAHTEAGLEERGAFPAYTECVIAKLDLRLSDTEVRHMYAELPDGADEEDAAAIVPPSFTQRLSSASIDCTRSLIHSGEYTRAEMLAMLRGLLPE